jgi:sporulation protein YlmC with PRC-barrel domain
LFETVCKDSDQKEYHRKSKKKKGGSFMIEQSKAKPDVLSATTIIGDEVRNLQGEDIGEIEELMININDGCIAYAVLSFGGLLGIGDKLFAVPWKALRMRPEEHAFVMDIRKEKLEQAPGFDKDNWPNMSDIDWANRVNSFYGITGSKLQS